MATTYYNDIQKLYVAYFNRPADPKGLEFWEKAVEAAKGSTAAVATEFSKSAEYTAAYKDMTNAQIVDQVYKNLFGRGATDSGAQFWIDGLNNKVITIADVVTAVAAGAQGTDAIAYNSKVTAAAAFTNALDTDAEVAGYSGDAANKIAKTFLAGVTDSLTLASATSPTALNGTVASAVAAGTTFSVSGALAQVNTATKALNDFVKVTATKDLNADGVKDSKDITKAQTDAVTKVANDLTDASAKTLFGTTTSQTVREALISGQQTVNAQKLSDVQKDVAKDNADIAKIAGLSDAVAVLTAAKTSLKAANAADVAAQADLAAKETAFGINNGVDGVASSAVTVKGTTLVFTPAGGVETVLANIGTDGTAKVSTASGFDATKYVGLTELIASFNADVATSVNAAKALENANYAQLGVSLLDVAPSTASVTITGAGAYAGTYTDAQLIAKIAGIINATTPDTVASGATPTVSQIQTELAVLKADPAKATQYADFKDLIDQASVKAGGSTLDATFNPLLAKLASDTELLTTTNDAIAALAKDVAALQAANVNADTLAGLTATVAGYNKVLTDKGYAVTTLDAAHTANFATAASDIYVVSNKDASIAAFGLQGIDSLFVGTGFTVVKGAIGDTGVKGNDAALEIFISSTAGGDAKLQIETHAYSSSVTGTGTGEVITITLTGVDASTLHLSADGIITTGTAA